MTRKTCDTNAVYPAGSWWVVRTIGLDKGKRQKPPVKAAEGY